MTSKERLERLIVVMEEVEAQHKAFSIRTWMSAPKNKDLTECGTTCCAAGYAALDPMLQAEGLQLVSWDGNTIIKTKADFLNLSKESAEGVVYPTYKFSTYFAALADFFGILIRDSEYLFSPYSYTEKYVTPSSVIQHIYRVLGRA